MTGPITDFERTGNLTNLKQEQDFLRKVESETNMRLRVIGRSTLGRPIVSCELGNPHGRTLLTVHGVHANERFTRELAQSFIRDLAYDPTPTELSYLQNNRVVVIPTANPDTVMDRRRENILGRDLNRTWITIDEAETIAIMREIRRTQPLTVVDSHQHNPAGNNQVSYSFKPNNPIISNGYMDTLSDHSENWMTSYMDDNNVTHAQFPVNANSHETMLRSYCRLNNINSMLIETNYRESNEVRLRASLVFMHGALEYNRVNQAFLESNIQNANAEAERGDGDMYIPRKTSAGNFDRLVSISDPGSFTIRQGAEIPYDLFVSLGIEITGRTVSTRQKARKHLGPLLSPDSYYYFEDWPQPPVMPVSGRGKVRIKGSAMDNLYLNLSPEFGA